MTMKNYDNSPIESYLEIEDIHKFYGDKAKVKALSGINLKVPKGNLVVLLGPSGCGKTTLLRILAGLEGVSKGRVSFFGETIIDSEKKIDIPAKDRNIGMVFQNYALWPHMKVIDNVAYPLRNQKVGKVEARKRALEVLKLLKCDELADRIPSQLSGGQQQRVALGRALVVSPSIVFFDEPLSNVDAQLRKEVRAEIRRLHQEIGFTGIYVTHDLAESLELAETIVVMSKGQVEQVGTPQQIFESPASAYVADFMGIENKFVVRKEAGSVISDFGTFEQRGVFRELPDGKYKAFVRATEVDLHTGDVGEDETDIGEWTIIDIMYGGDKTDLILERADQKIISSGNPLHRNTLIKGQQVTLKIHSLNTLTYPLEHKVE